MKIDPTLAPSEKTTAKEKTQPEINFDKTYLNDPEASAFLNVAEPTLRKSRVTGVLLGFPAPKFRKRGRKVDTSRVECEKFNAQFSEYQNTSQSKGV